MSDAEAKQEYENQRELQVMQPTSNHTTSIFSLEHIARRTFPHVSGGTGKSEMP